MPWKNNEYVVSAWSKLELPTWAEVYYDFYKGGYYNPTESESDDQWTIMDPYWKITKWKYLWAMVCNQFNKMIHEDGQFSQYSDMIMLASNRDYSPLPIYTLPNPHGHEDPFIVDKPGFIRVNVADELFHELKFKFYDGHEYNMFQSEFVEILETLMEPFKSYFENGVGWKDSNGHVYTAKRIKFDPAADPAL